MAGNLLAGFILVLGQEPIRLEFKPLQGDRLLIAEARTFLVTGKDTSQHVEYVKRTSQKTVVDVRKVQGGQVMEVALDCRGHKGERKSPPCGEWRQEELPLNGRLITLSLTDGKILRKGVEGVPENELRALRMEDPTSALFPKHALSPGESWEVGTDQVQSLLGPSWSVKEGKAKLVLVEIRNVDGRRCAVISASFLAKGKNDVAAEVEIAMEAESVVWIERGYTLSFKGRGKLHAKELGTSKLAGEGHIEIDREIQVMALGSER